MSDDDRDEAAREEAVAGNEGDSGSEDEHSEDPKTEHEDEDEGRDESSEPAPSSKKGDEPVREPDESEAETTPVDERNPREIEADRLSRELALEFSQHEFEDPEIEREAYAVMREGQRVSGVKAWEAQQCFEELTDLIEEDRKLQG